MAKRQCYWCGVWTDGPVCRLCGDDLDEQAANLEKWERERLEKLANSNDADEIQPRRTLL